MLGYKQDSNKTSPAEPAPEADPVNPPDRPICVVLVVDHPILRAGIRSLLEEMAGVEILAEAGDKQGNPEGVFL